MKLKPPRRNGRNNATIGISGLPTDLKGALKKMAEANHCTFAEQVRVILHAHIDGNGKKRKRGQPCVLGNLRRARRSGAL